jgi:hypothetical protein
MSSQSRSSEREEERRLNIRTLAIASAASAAAALVTSQLWIAGTWVAAALTPVIVALVSEMLHRPTERIAKMTTDRPALRAEEARPLPPPPRRGEGGLVRPGEGGVVPRGEGAAAPRSEAGPVKVYRSGAAEQRARSGRRRKIALGTVAVTAALAFLIAVVAITVPELVAGQSLGGGDRSTSFFGSDSRTRDRDTATGPERQPATGQPQETTTVTVPEEETTVTVPAPPAQGRTETVPTQTETAPAQP